MMTPLSNCTQNIHFCLVGLFQSAWCHGNSRCSASSVVLYWRIIVRSPNSISFLRKLSPCSWNNQTGGEKRLRGEQHGSENGIGYQIHNARNSFAGFPKRGCLWIRPLSLWCQLSYTTRNSVSSVGGGGGGRNSLIIILLNVSFGEERKRKAFTCLFSLEKRWV